MNRYVSVSVTFVIQERLLREKVTQFMIVFLSVKRSRTRKRKRTRRKMRRRSEEGR